MGVRLASSNLGPVVDDGEGISRLGELRIRNLLAGTRPGEHLHSATGSTIIAQPQGTAAVVEFDRIVLGLDSGCLVGQEMPGQADGVRVVGECNATLQFQPRQQLAVAALRAPIESPSQQLAGVNQDKARE